MKTNGVKTIRFLFVVMDSFYTVGKDKGNGVLRILKKLKFQPWTTARLGPTSQLSDTR